MSRAGPGRRSKLLAELVSGVMAPIVARRAAMSMELLAAWPELAGPQFADNTRPEKINWPRRVGDDDPFEPGVLVVACDGGSALRMQHEGAALVERINVFLGFRAVARLRIVQKPVRRLRQAARDSSGTLGPADARHLEQLLSGVEDPQLRSRLEKLGRGVLARARGRKPE